MSAHHAHLPGSPARNGLPERRDYAYQGTGEDTRTGHLTVADLEPYKVSYDQWLPQFAHGARKARTGDACPDCSYKRGGANCRAICGGAR